MTKKQNQELDLLNTWMQMVTAAMKLKDTYSLERKL